MGPGADARTASEDLTEVARRAELAGIANTLSVHGAPAEHHEQARLAVNRIVRECLTNAGRHAPGQPVLIDVSWEEGEARVHASNAVSSGPVATGVPVPGRGLSGMRHRAELLGGTFDAGPCDGRFDVRVVLPLPAGAAR
jgi:signal transduction histidine kinase